MFSLLVLLSGCAGDSGSGPGGDPSGSSTGPPPPPPPPYPVLTMKPGGDHLNLEGDGVFRVEINVNKDVNPFTASSTGGTGSTASGPQWVFVAPLDVFGVANETAPACGPVPDSVRARYFPNAITLADNWDGRLPQGKWLVLAYIAGTGSITLGFNATPQTTSWKNITAPDDYWTAQQVEPDRDSSSVPVSPYETSFEQSFAPEAPALLVAWFTLNPQFSGTGSSLTSRAERGSTQCALSEDTATGPVPSGTARSTEFAVLMTKPGAYLWSGEGHMDAAFRDPQVTLGGHFVQFIPAPEPVNTTAPAA